MNSQRRANSNMTTSESLIEPDMEEVAPSIDLDLPRKLQDPEYRKKFFWAETSANIAAQLVALRKRRALNQTQVAALIGTKQPAVSRAEQADYQNYNLTTLRAWADGLGARVRVYIQPYEDVLHEYEDAADPVVNPGTVAGAVSAPAVTSNAAQPSHSASTPENVGEIQGGLLSINIAPVPVLAPPLAAVLADQADLPPFVIATETQNA